MLPNDPSNQSNNPPASIPSNPSYPPIPQISVPVPPDYPHPSIHQETAQHRLRDAHGQFLPYEHPTNPIPTVPNPDTTPNSLNTLNPSNSADSSETPKPESNFKRFIKFIVKIKWAKVSLYIVSFIGVLNIIINLPPVKNSINQLFPNSSPVFAREISIQGTLRSSDAGLYVLVLPDQQAYTLHFKPSASLTNLKKLNIDKRDCLPKKVLSQDDC